jgi:hypothetical protein
MDVEEIGVSPAFDPVHITRELNKEIIALGKSLGCEKVWYGTRIHTPPGISYRAHLYHELDDEVP